MKRFLDRYNKLCEGPAGILMIYVTILVLFAPGFLLVWIHHLWIHRNG